MPAQVTILKKKSYLAMIRNSARGENHMFRNRYATVDGMEQDIVHDGSLACSFFASTILFINKLIKDMHAGVVGLERDLEASGWVQINDLREGAVLTWEPQVGSDDQSHMHVGFYVGNDMAVSNNSNEFHVPREHHYTYNDTRKIIRIWWHPELD